jgi:hypothetical protein
MPTVSDPVELPASASELVAEIKERTGTKAGVWDVLAWRRDSFRFVEAKRRGRDRIQPAQRAFLEAALHAGQPPEAFLVVSWSLR